MSLGLINGMLMFQAFRADNLAIKSSCSETTDHTHNLKLLKETYGQSVQQAERRRLVRIHKGTHRKHSE